MMTPAAVTPACRTSPLIRTEREDEPRRAKPHRGARSGRAVPGQPYIICR